MGVPVEKEGARVNYEASAVETSIKDVRPLLDLVDKLRTLGVGWKVFRKACFNNDVCDLLSLMHNFILHSF